MSGHHLRNPINVTVSFDGEEPTLLKNQRVSYDALGNILLAPLLESLTQQGFEVDGQVLYFSDKDKNYVLAGKYPLPGTAAVPNDELDQSRPLQIKLRAS